MIIYWYVDDREAANYHRMNRTAPNQRERKTKKSYLAPNVNSTSLSNPGIAEHKAQQGTREDFFYLWFLVHFTALAKPDWFCLSSQTFKWEWGKIQISVLLLTNNIDIAPVIAVNA